MFAERLGRIEPFAVMEVLEKALEMERKGIEIIHLEIGEPDFDTPARISEAGFRALKEGKTHYTHSMGIIELREAISEYKLNTRGTYYDPEKNIMITGGTSPAFFNIMGALINPGDGVVITDPGYPCYRNFVSFFGGRPIPVPIYEEDNFDIRVEEIGKIINPKTRMIILNSPSNPTGQIIRPATLEKLVDLLAEHPEIYILSDEIYSELTYTGNRAPSLSESKYSEIHDRLIVVDGFSKFWAMTGWRIGYILAPEEVISGMVPIQQNFTICAPSVSQYAALEALKCKKETAEMLMEYRKRRDYMVRRINAMDKISCIEPAGAFYVFVNISNLEVNSLTFCKRLLEEAKVAATPGSAFGNNGVKYVRFSYTNNLENIERAMDNLERFLNEAF